MSGCEEVGCFVYICADVWCGVDVRVGVWCVVYECEEVGWSV